jgi:hypothetical protein
MTEVKLFDVALTKGLPKQERNSDANNDCETSLMPDPGLVLFHGCAAKEEAQHHCKED